MRGMEYRNARAGKSLWLAVVISLLLHAAVLFIRLSAPGSPPGPASNADPADHSTRAARPRLEASLARPLLAPPPPPPSALRKPAAAPQKPAAQRKLTAPTGVWANRSFSSAERADMDNFLNELAAQAKPPGGRELSQRALAMASQLGRTAPEDGAPEGAGQPAGNARVADPFSLEMYFDAFVRKLNRSAAFVRNEPRSRGTRKALVQISLNADGSLKSYRVLRSGDQAAEIAYIKDVIDRASPFSAFPPDIRNIRDSLSILMCIYPARDGGGGGFSRSFGAQDCQD